MFYRKLAGPFSELLVAAAMTLAWAYSVAAADVVSGDGTVSVLTVSADANQLTNAVDYSNARAAVLPIAPAYTHGRAQLDVIQALAVDEPANPRAPTQPRFPQLAGVQKGDVGNGTKFEVDLGVRRGSAAAITSPTGEEESGTARLPFSTARADLDPTPTNDQWPYRASGKLFFKDGNQTYVCSASLIKRGLVVTAAHCVADFGKRKYYSDWRFVPGYRDGVAPYGSWSVAQALVLDSYYKGTDSCSQVGVVCQSDVAVLVLNPQRDASNTLFYVGNNTGWYAFGWNNAGFTSSGITHITQVGYPGCLDNGAFMQRNDTQGVVSPSFSNNTVTGSLMCGGSSGGPWLINFGIRPQLTGTTSGASAQPNMVIGVTSWGSTDSAVKQMGSSPFLNTNIGALVRSACNAHPNACN